MEEQVKEALSGESRDFHLGALLEITVLSIREGRPLFPSILDEPVFYRRHFKRWVEEYIEEETAIHRVAQGALAAPNAVDVEF